MFRPPLSLIIELRVSMLLRRQRLKDVLGMAFDTSRARKGW